MATTGMSTASTTCGSSTVVATSPVCPPPSPPCTTTASAPHAATFSACRRAPTDGMTTTPASLSSAISSLDGASANDATRTPSSTMIRTRSRASPASARRFTPKGAPSVRDFTSRTASRSCAGVIVAEARMPSAPAFAVAETRRGLTTQPIPVCTIGRRMPTRRVSAVSISHSPLSAAASAARPSVSLRPRVRACSPGRSPRGSASARHRSVHACTAPRPGRRGRSRSPP